MNVYNFHYACAHHCNGYDILAKLTQVYQKVADNFAEYSVANDDYAIQNLHGYVRGHL